MSRLVSPEVTVVSPMNCLTFYLNSFYKGSWKVYPSIRVYQQYSIDDFSGIKIGNFEFVGKDGSDWRKQTITLQDGKYFIGFEAFIGQTQISDIAIDRIRLEHKTQCQGKIQCMLLFCQTNGFSIT